MGLLFKSSKSNKKFNYKPRYYQSDKGGSPFEAKNRYESFRKNTWSGSGNIKQKFKNAVDDLKNNPDRRATRTVLLIALILIFIFLLLIDFDLTIFLPK
jgi:hypothetical protein